LAHNLPSRVKEVVARFARVRVLRIWRAVRDALTAEDIELEH
jgi:hypothetical protein